MSLIPSQSYKRWLKKSLLWPWQAMVNYWHKNWWTKTKCIVVGLAILLTGIMYGIGQWYVWSQRNEPFTLGVTYIADYAEFLGLNPHQTLLALMDDLQVHNFRFVSYWNDIEPTKGSYNFTELDSEFHEADIHHAKVILSIGLRQPRWPECHQPSWTDNEPYSVWEPQLLQFMSTVINRYKNNPALQSYQLENEYYLSSFGLCTNHRPSRFLAEYNLVRKLDPDHNVMFSRDENDFGWPVNPPLAEEYGITIYQRVWTPVLGRYIEYPYPSWYFAFLGGIEEIWNGKNTIVQELQAEPWPPNGAPIPSTTLAQQNMSFDAADIKSRVDFVKATGMKAAYLWGAEYWYYRLVVLHDPSVWNAAKAEFKTANQ